MANPTAVHADAVHVVISGLRSGLASQASSATVGSRVPAGRSKPFVVVRRTGGVALNRVADDAQITVESYDSTPEAAHDLLQLCRALIHSFRGSTVLGVPVYRVAEFSGPIELPDPLSNDPRYSMTLTIALRGEAL